MAHRTCADMTWHAKPRGRASEPTRHAGGAQVHTGGVDAWVVPRGRGAGIWRAHGLVGPGNSIGTVTQ